MNRALPRLVSVAAVLGAQLTLAAEDHSAHHMPMPDPHAQHSAAPADQPTESEARHVSPDAPQHLMRDMSEREMIELMGMDDTSAFGMVRFDQFEWRKVDNVDALEWDTQAWYGNDYDKVWIKTEGERLRGEVEASSELLWDRVFARWWNVQAGVRHDVGEGPSRTWAAFGIHGVAPYRFEVEATAYVGEQGRTALRFSGDYEGLLTQRLILQPKLEFNLYGKDDAANGIGAGVSDSEFGVRLRYEFRREVAPYVGLAWIRSYGNTADLARAAGRDTSEMQWLAGIRFWF